MGQFGIGQPVRRKEDVRLVTGKGQFTDDAAPERAAHAVFVRSPHAHARILSIDTAEAKAAPGVVAVYTHADMATDGVGIIYCAAPLKNADGSDYVNPGRPVLATGIVRCVGEPVAMVVAETAALARDAAELVMVEYEELPAVTRPREAIAPGAPVLHEKAPDNVAHDWELGNKAETEAAFAAAHRVIGLDLEINRVMVFSLEARGVVAEYDAATGRYTVWLGTQGVMGQRRIIAKSLGVTEDKVRVVSKDIGGSFGMKSFEFPENGLVPWAARKLGRPVRWASDRQESFVSDSQGREQSLRVELALDAQHRFLGIRVDSLANIGAYLSTYSLFIPTMAGYRLLTGAYRIPAAHVRVRSIFTNTVSIDAYRGAGRPETSYIVERIVDHAAAELGISAAELRRLNFVPPEAMPYKTPVIARYDSGNFPATFEKGLEFADVAGFAARKAASERNGRLRGLGLGYYLEVTAAMPQEKADVRFLSDGRITMRIGCGPSGQGHATAFSQILEDRLGVGFDRIELVTGDSDELTQGSGTGGAKTLMLAGTAIVDAAEKIIAKGRALAGHFLEAAVEDIEFQDGVFAIAGTDRRIAIADLAKRTAEATGLPEELPKTLDESGFSSADKNTYPNGLHVCEVEIDRETGETRVDRYMVVDDFGKLINPLIVEGQIHGGIVQGIGQALLEDVAYDPESGQLLSGSLMDYAVPRAADAPDFQIAYNHDPCRTNALGIKGAGEAGTVGALGAVMNAIVDALRPFGVKNFDMPATPLRVWQAMNGGNAG